MSAEERDRPRPRIPVSTYRLQFNAGFTFRDARALLPYLRGLGISDIYASPYFKAGPGSSSGYDIVDPTVLNPEVGAEEDYASLVAEMHRLGMGQILDVVPNHLCITCGGNVWWQDVLENGVSSPHAAFFDIDWRPAGRRTEAKLLVPILASQYGEALEGQELRLTIEKGAFAVLYQNSSFPLAPETYPVVLGFRREALASLMPQGDAAAEELASLTDAFERLPPYTETEAARISERSRDKEILKKRLAALLENSPPAAAFLDENVRIFNGVKGDHRSFDRLDVLLDRQVWRLAHWRVSTEEINYRRFFDLNHLAAIRVEDREVFEKVHERVFRLIDEGAVTGLRIDHTDGLADPAAYLKDLQERRRTDGGAQPLLYVVVEKILSDGEALPPEWPVQGTTGYEFLNAVNGLFVAPRNAAAFDAIYGRFTGARARFADLLYEKKKLVMQVALSGEANALAHRLEDIAVRNRHSRDFPLNSLTRALVEVVACFPVYRTYVRATGIGDTDRRTIARAVGEAKRRNPAMSRLIFDFLGQVLLLEPPVEGEERERADRLAFVRKFQQFTGPVMAKGLEDTACYVDNRLVSLNEVGGRPDRFGLTPEAFHARNIERLKAWPHGLNATSTHDTKRSEDVRARIDVLSEMPRLWRARLAAWKRANARFRRALEPGPAPDRNEEYLIYQTLLGAWPLEAVEGPAGEAFTARIKAYILKAIREAKVNTSWIDQNAEHEEAVTGFIADILGGTPPNRFLQDFRPFQALVSDLGMYNALSQTLLKIAAPGVPDFYQGAEIWDYSLVDPDNRRPVDHGKRIRLLESLDELEKRRTGAEIAADLMSLKEDGRIKLFVISRALRFREKERRLFESGDYRPLAAEGPRAGNVVAFARAVGTRAVLAVVPRFCSELVPAPGDRPLGEPVWRDTVLPLPTALASFEYRNIFTGKSAAPSRDGDRASLALGAVFSDFPVALLVSGD
jgi:(1->4)-alpha-D-glucan 1-alpha-D-glucosylmutase